MKSLLYGTSGINRLKLLRFMRLYGFFTAWGSTAWGKLLPTIRLYPLYTVFYCLGSTAWGSFCRRYGFVWCAVLTVFHGFAAQRLGFEFGQTQKR